MVTILQIFDNALASAGLLDDYRAMVQRINLFLEKSLEAPSDLASTQEPPKDTKSDIN